MIALAVRHRGDNLDGAFDHMLDLGQSHLDHRSELGKALGGLHPIIGVTVRFVQIVPVPIFNYFNVL
jgi:hypothetical protein